MEIIIKENNFEFLRDAIAGHVDELLKEQMSLQCIKADIEEYLHKVGIDSVVIVSVTDSKSYLSVAVKFPPFCEIVVRRSIKMIGYDITKEVTLSFDNYFKIGNV